MMCIPLKVRSAYSLAESTVRLYDLLAKCQEMGVPAVAVTDHHNLFGALEFASNAARAGIQPIIGCALSIQTPDVPVKAGEHLPQLFVYVQNETGYLNLSKLLSQSYITRDPAETPHITLEHLQGNTEGLLAATGSLTTTTGKMLSAGQYERAFTHIKVLQELFPERLYIEIARQDSAAEAANEAALLDAAHTLNLPLLAAQDVFFLEKELHGAHDILLGIGDSTTVSNPARRQSNPQHYFKHPAELQQLFADIPEALHNTVHLAQRCAFMPEARKPILPRFSEDEAESLKTQAFQGLEKRLAHYKTLNREIDPEPYQQRLEYELNTIISMGFAGYFLIVADFIGWSKQQGIPVGPGRGSGAGSVVAWVLSITDLDPLELNLLFERFLNPERVSMPDFDIDFCQDRRDEVIAYVQQKYGADKVAQIITFGKLQARAVLRDVGRVLELPYGQVDRICKLVPNNPANPMTLQEAIDFEPQLRAIQQEEETSSLMDISLQLEGLYRHASTHAAGVVIGDRPLEQLVPLYRDVRSTMPATQFNMKYAETAGLVKFDFLGLKTLTVMQKACALIKERCAVDVDLLSLPMDDKKTYALLSSGETMGVFQLESAGMRDVLRKLKPDRFADIIALVALYRPGPMDNIPRYIACKHELEQPDYLHESLQPILQETFGVMIYQEQVMQIAQVLAGYSLGAADLLRRAMGKKIKEEMDAQRALFVDGATAKGVEKNTASFIFDQVAKFAGYGFNKSHAAAYALIAYQTAWLKANYPAEFLAATMTYELGNTDKLGLFRQEALRMNLSVLPPDVNTSKRYFAVESDGKALRYALTAIKGIGEAPVLELVTEREKNGAYTGLYDFTKRLAGRGLNKRFLENMCYAGAFDSLHKSRAAVFANIETAVASGVSSKADDDSGQESLFGITSLAPAVAPKFIEHPEWSPLEKLGNEFTALGLYLSAHPMDSYQLALDKMKVTLAKDVAEIVSSKGAQRLTMAGIVTAKKERKSAKGNRFAFVQFSDTSGVFEVMMFSEVLAASRELLEQNVPLLVSVDATEEGEGYRLLAQMIRPLDGVAADVGLGIELTINEEKTLSVLSDILAQEPRGNAQVLLKLPSATGHLITITLPQRYALSMTTRQKVKGLAGVKAARDVA